MPKLPLRIEVVRSTKKSLSSLSELSARDIVTLLSKHFSDVRMTNVNSVDDLTKLVDRQPDLVFCGIYYVHDTTGSTKIWLADELEKHHIAYTGSGSYANKLSLDKDLAKQRMIEKGIRTAAFKLARRVDGSDIDTESLTYPLFVKPSNKSAGIGVDEFSIVHSDQQLKDKIHSIHTIQETDALVEEYLSGREFTVALIDDSKGSFTAMPLELITAIDKNGHRLRSKSVRSRDDEELINVTDLTERQLVGQIAIDAFHAIGGGGHGRIDIRFNESGVPFFLEANHIPSLSKINSSFMRGYEFSFGSGYETMIMHIVRIALEPRKL